MKKIFVVGNGSVKNDLSKIVDKADFVFRFNSMCNYNQNTGKKTDIWVQSSNRALINRLIEDPSQVELNTKIKIKEYLMSDIKILFTTPNYFPIKKRFIIESERKERYESVIKFLTHYDLMCQRYEMIDFPVKYLFDLNPERWNLKHKCPSNGYLITRYLIDKDEYSGYEINLVGFTWEGWEGHPWEYEKKYLKMLHLNKIIKIIV